MSAPRVEILTPDDIAQIHAVSLRILERTSVVVPHDEVLRRLADGGLSVDFGNRRVRLSAEYVVHALEQTAKTYTLRGRDPRKVARYGYGDLNLIASPGQYAWFDHKMGIRREPSLPDARQAAKLGDALPNITIVGAMTVPTDVPAAIQDVVLTAELVKSTAKPTRCWPVTRQSSRYVLEIYAALAGGRAALRQAPMVETFLEPISPLQLPQAGLDVMLEYLDYGQPIAVGPMVMASGTGPATLAGTLAQENAEILAGLTIIQSLAPGTPVLYSGIPHILDPRTSICSFGSPEQGLMGLAMAQLGKHYGLPVYINVNLTDSKTLDVQAGMEKMGSFVIGVLAGADLFGHAGIVGTDHGGSLLWLVVDDEAMHYARRVARGFAVNSETLAEEVVAETGPGGNYMAHPHTLRHYRNELWMPGKLWTRDSYDGWAGAGGSSMADRAAARAQELLGKHEVAPLEPALEREIDRIVAAARAELVG